MKIIKIIQSCFFTFKAFFNNKKGNFNESIKNSDKALHIDPNHFGAYWFKGTALYKLGKYKEALNSYNKSLELKPKNKYCFEKEGFQILNNIGLCYAKLNERDKAIDFFNEAIKSNRYNYKAYAGKACIYSLQNNKEKAIENLKRAIEINPNYKTEVRKDKDFNNIKDLPEFKKIIEK